MRMTNRGKTFRIQSENPLQTKVLFEAGKADVCPRASGITMDDGRAIDFYPSERLEMCLVGEWIYHTFGGEHGRTFDALCGAGMRGEEEAIA